MQILVRLFASSFNTKLLVINETILSLFDKQYHKYAKINYLIERLYKYLFIESCTNNSKG